MKKVIFRPSLDGLETRVVPDARLQIIHAAPFAAVAKVDIYVNDQKLLDDVAFRTATPYLTVPSGKELKIDIVPGAAANNAKPAVTTKVTLPDNSVSVVAAINEASGAVRIVSAPGKETSATGKADVLVLHASPDTPNSGGGFVDVRVRGVGNVIDSLAFGDFANTEAVNPSADKTGYNTLPAGKYIFDLARGVLPDVSTSKINVPEFANIASATADLSAGGPVVVVATGFSRRDGNPVVIPESLKNESGNDFGLLAVRPDGKTALLPGATRQTFAVGGLNGKAGIYSPDFVNPRVLEVTAPNNGNGSARVAQADVNGDGVQDLIVGSAPGVPSRVQITDGATQKLIRTINPFESTFLGGLNISSGDLNGDGFEDVVISPDIGGGPRVQVVSGKDGGVLVDFLGIEDSSFRGGASAAIGDLNNDGKADLLVGAGFGGGPRVSAFDGSKLTAIGGPKLFADFFAFENSFRGGVNVAAGDINGDGFVDPIVTPGPGGGPRVYIPDGKELTRVGASTVKVLADFLATQNGFTSNANLTTGIRIAVTDFDSDAKADIIVGYGFTDFRDGTDPPELNTIREAQAQLYRGAEVTKDPFERTASLIQIAPIAGPQTDRIYVG
ncbi:MAG: DUF4397 domain-containing protein [Fimbriiglobus sp.]